ncbi:hypothetical protein BJ546DRAFT_1011554 [Cryomyces antarcticus]
MGSFCIVVMLVVRQVVKAAVTSIASLVVSWHRAGEEAGAAWRGERLGAGAGAGAGAGRGRQAGCVFGKTAREARGGGDCTQPHLYRSSRW